MLCVLDDKNTFDNEEDNSESGEEERHLQASIRREEVIRAIKWRRIGVGVVNVHIPSFSSNVSFPHKITCEKLVTNWFIGYSERNIVEYRRLIPEYLVPVKN